MKFIMKKRIFTIFLSIILLILSVLPLTGCGRKTPDLPSSHGTEETDGENSDAEETDRKIPGKEDTDTDTASPAPFSHALPQKPPTGTDYIFPETSPFIDDTGKSMQRDGNFLYSYYSGRLIRFDKDTEETILLYQTASTHKVNFCLHEDEIYFVERTGFDSLDDRDTSLWRMGKFGKNLTLLQGDIINAGTMRDYNHYMIDIYDDILYLISYTSSYENEDYVTKTANLYFRLKNDGSVSEVDESETLYGTLPRRFSPVFDGDFPTLPYAMRNYGYIFMQDADDVLYRMEPVNDARERIDRLDMDAVSRFAFSGDLIFMSSYEEKISLYNLSDRTLITTKILSDYTSYPKIYPSGQGFFLCDDLRSKDSTSSENSSRFTILYISSDSSIDVPFSDMEHTLEYDFNNTLLRENSCIDENYLYYYQSDETESRLMRFFVGEDPTFQVLDVLPLYEASSPAVLVAEENSEETDLGSGGGSVSSYTRKLLLEERTDADRLINRTLKEVYADHASYVNEHIADKQEWIKEEENLYEDFGYTSNDDFSLSVYLDYMDDDTISFECCYYQYFAGAAHGYYWSDFYVFNRETGERLSFEDFAGDPASIIATARPYVEKAAGWDFDSEMLLEISRFSLSADGYTLYFAPYDIDCYAAGSFLITIPYEAFEKEL